MNRAALGDEGVVAVRSFFNRLGYIKPYVNSDDTQPIWDGSLFIYNDREEFNNERLLFTVTLQVKAEEYHEEELPNSTSFDVELVNLRNYLIDGGVVFFHVLVGPERNQIYVAFLTKATIQKYIETARGNKFRTIRLEKIPKTYSTVVSRLRTLHLQKTHNLITYEEEKKYPNVQWAIDSFGLTESHNPLEYITSNPVNILAYVDGLPEPLFVGEDAARIATTTLPQLFDISVNGKVYYHSFTREVKGNTQIVKFGKSVELTFKKEGPDSISVFVNIELKADSLEEIIHEVEFIVSIFETKEIFIGENKMDFSMNESAQDLKEWQTKLVFWKEVKDLFDLLHIEEPLNNIQAISDAEIKRLRTLIAGLLYKKNVVGTNGMKTDHLEWISVSNLRILVFARYISDNKYRLEQVFEHLSAYYHDSKGKPQTASVYSKVIAEDVLASNIDWSRLLQSYRDITSINPEFFERANWDVLWLIKWYDKTQRTSILDAANELLSYIMQYDNQTTWRSVWKYNLLQIKARRNEPLSDDDNSWLLDQEESIDADTSIDNTQRIFSKFAIQVLLYNALKAKRIYSKMTDEQQAFIAGLPIFNLYENLITTT